MNRNQSHKRRPQHRSPRSGATIFLLLLLLVIVIGMAAVAVDVGMMVMLRAEVQNAVDAGALAAGLTLQTVGREVDAAEAAARRYVQLNRTGTALTIPDNYIDVEQGQFDPETNVFRATTDNPNAVRVFARQENEPLYFGRIFGRTHFGAPASAIAAAGSRAMDIMLVLDLSLSMHSEGRIQALWVAVPQFVDLIQSMGDNDRIGVMGLATDPEDPLPIKSGTALGLYMSGLHPDRDYFVGVLEATLTSDFSALKTDVLGSTNLIAGKYSGRTGTGAALGDAAHYLTYGPGSRLNAARVIVLMSDGYANQPTDAGPAYAEEMARYAARRDIEIYTISLGNEADVPFMQRIADIGGGKHFDATGAGIGVLSERLTAAFRQAALSMKRMQLVR